MNHSGETDIGRMIDMMFLRLAGILDVSDVPRYSLANIACHRLNACRTTGTQRVPKRIDLILQALGRQTCQHSITAKIFIAEAINRMPHRSGQGHQKPIVRHAIEPHGTISLKAETAANQNKRYIVAGV